MKAKRLSKRHRAILETLRDLDGRATLHQISKKSGRHTNGLSQSFNIFERDGYARHVGGEAGEAEWLLLPKGLATITK